MPLEQLVAEPVFELPNARRNVGLHTVQLAGRADDAALGHHSTENLQRVQIDGSHKKNDGSR
jgi:hypothetical protein